MPEIIDVSHACGSRAGFLASNGVKTIIRYYSRDTGQPLKRLARDEARSFSGAGLKLCIVHEARHGDRIESFSEDLGHQDGTYAREYAATEIGQPAGSVIYFAVDFDATVQQIQDAVLPFFRGIAEAMSGDNGLPRYRIGIYGSGAVCAAVLDATLAEFAWLAQSRGWLGFKAFLDSNRWTMRQLMPSNIGEIGCDPDIANPGNPDIGDFSFAAPPPVSAPTPPPAPPPAPLMVIARAGLRLRSGPGTEFDVLKVLPNGAKVHPIKAVGDWTMVDLNGDGAADGFVNTHFLAPVA
jgi:hypothetical protein